MEKRAALERFVVENDDLLTLESRVGKFNIFDALRITHVELRHSNFLAFILNPAESHGHGQLFLRAVLMDLLRNAALHLRPLSPIELDGAELRGIEVKREWKNIDLLITCEIPRFAVVVENKVGSREHSDQLSRYRKAVTDHFPGLPCLYVHLSADGDEPSEDSWLPYTYAHIHRVLKRIRMTYENSIGDDVLVFLDQYLSLLETRFMNDEKLEELCRQIYKNHRRAIDLIVQVVGSPGSEVLAEVANALEEDIRWEVVDSGGGKVVNSVPKSWLQWLPPLGNLYEDKKIWIVLKIELFEERLGCFVELQGMSDEGLRKRIGELLLGEASRFGFKRSRARGVTGNFTHITAIEFFLEWPDDAEPDAEKTRSAVKMTLDDIYPKLEKLALVLRPICDFRSTAESPRWGT